LWAASLVVLSSACGAPRAAQPLPIDLVRELPRARIQAPAGAPGVRVDFAPGENGPTPAVLMTAPSRVTWTLQFQDTAEITTRVALLEAAGSGRAVTLRVGISDNRRYNELVRLPIASAAAGPAQVWQPVSVDLSPYSGWKWSLFYHPARIAWNVIFNADATPGGTVALTELRVVKSGSSQK
jgi:hypothetical protein